MGTLLLILLGIDVGLLILGIVWSAIRHGRTTVRTGADVGAEVYSEMASMHSGGGPAYEKVWFKGEGVAVDREAAISYKQLKAFLREGSWVDAAPVVVALVGLLGLILIGPLCLIALWYPVEAFRGRVLDNRKRIGEHYYEAWRAISPDDVVAVPTQVRIAGIEPARVQRASDYDLLATSTKAAIGDAIEFIEAEGTLLSPELSVGPMPAVLVVDLK